jgi:hypothetical protein
MGRSRVYCTPPANANRQHNTAAARTIPLEAPGEWRASADRAAECVRPHLLGYATRASAAATTNPSTWVSNKSRGSRAVGM